MTVTILHRLNHGKAARCQSRLDAMPKAWLAELELRDVIEEIADDLCDFADWPIDGFGDEDGLVDRTWRK
jgi:hypothetical protein